MDKSTDTRSNKRKRRRYDVIYSCHKRYKCAVPARKPQDDDDDAKSRIFRNPLDLPTELVEKILLFLDLGMDASSAAIAQTCKAFRPFLIGVIPFIKRIHLSRAIQKHASLSWPEFALNNFFEEMHSTPTQEKRTCYCFLDETSDLHDIPMMESGGLLYLYGNNHATVHWGNKRDIHTIVSDLVSKCQLKAYLDALARNVVIIVEAIRLREIRWPIWCYRQDKEPMVDSITLVIYGSTQSPDIDFLHIPPSVGRFLMVGRPASHCLEDYRKWIRQSRKEKPQMKIDVIDTHRTTYTNMTYGPVSSDWTDIGPNDYWATI